MYVKFSDKGQIRYGDTEDWSEEGKKIKTEGKVLVDDAVTPEQIVMKPTDYTAVNFNEVWAYKQAEYKKAKEKSDKIEGCKVGKLLRFQVADGYSWYVVKKVRGDVVTLEWRGFDPDGYVDQALGYEGIMKKSQCESRIKLGEIYKKMFDKEK